MHKKTQQPQPPLFPSFPVPRSQSAKPKVKQVKMHCYCTMHYYNYVSLKPFKRACLLCSLVCCCLGLQRLLLHWPPTLAGLACSTEVRSPLKIILVILIPPLFGQGTARSKLERWELVHQSKSSPCSATGTMSGEENPSSDTQAKDELMCPQCCSTHKSVSKGGGIGGGT